jgi:chitinase
MSNWSEDWHELKMKIANDWDGLEPEQYKAFMVCDVALEYGEAISSESANIVIGLLDNVSDGIIESLKDYAIQDTQFKSSVEELNLYIKIVDYISKYLKDDSN